MITPPGYSPSVARRERVGLRRHVGADVELDQGMLGERDRRGISGVTLAVDIRDHPSALRADLARAQWLPPDVEELAQRERLGRRRLDMDDPVARVGVEPVEALTAGDEGTRIAVDGLSRRIDADARRDLPWLAGHEDREMRVDVERGLLVRAALEPVDRSRVGA